MCGKNTCIQNPFGNLTFESGSQDMIKCPEVTKSYDSPMGFNRVLHVVPCDTISNNRLCSHCSLTVHRDVLGLGGLLAICPAFAQNFGEAGAAFASLKAKMRPGRERLVKVYFK